MEGGYPWVPKGITRKNTRVWVGLGLCLNSMGIFGLGTHKVQNFGFLGYYPWVPKIQANSGLSFWVVLGIKPVGKILALPQTNLKLNPQQTLRSM